MVIFICLMFLALSSVSASEEEILINADINNVDEENFNALNDENYKNYVNADPINLAEDDSSTIDDDFIPDDESNETETANFTELNELIDSSDSILYLTKDYEAINDTDNLTIAKSITLYGINHTLDCKNATIIIDANDSEVIFENLTFKDAKFLAEDLHDLNISFNDCNFEFYQDDEAIELHYEVSKTSHTGPIDEKIRKKALSIIGKSKDLAACKKLAVWVGKNVIHESNEGFYQSPLTTLNRKRGNCCCQANLFLQMCEAVGLTQNHKFYFIHVGQAYFKARHFFVMVDNLLVDVDAKPDDPWGQASILNRGIYRITQYPTLPLVKKY
jgi:hypothetical protein